jgi:hypothetical protein
MGPLLQCCRTQWMSSIWLLPFSVTCLSSTSLPTVQPPYLRGTWTSLVNVSGEYSHCKQNKTPNGLPCSLPMLQLSLLCVTELSLPWALQLHLAFSETLRLCFKHRQKVHQVACTLLVSCHPSLNLIHTDRCRVWKQCKPG